MIWFYWIDDIEVNLSVRVAEVIILIIVSFY